jgi:hypothetical protein
MATQYLLLMRHVAGWKFSYEGVDGKVRSHEYPHLLSKGVQAATAVAERLNETLRELPAAGEIKVAAVWHAPDHEPTATATIVSELAGLGSPQSQTFLKPSEFHPMGGPFAGHALHQTQKTIEQELASHPGRALLIVGHEPQLAWLAQRMTRRLVPVDRGELVCLARMPGGRWRLAWTIHPDDESAENDIRDKIKSKMDAAKVMGAFITALVTFVLAQFLQHDDPSRSTLILRGITVGLLFAAASLFFLSLFHYDTLLMPVRFWGSRAPRTPDPDSWKREHPSPDWLIRRPPSSSAWVLYQNMMRIWNYTFIPAVWLTGAALITLCQSIMRLRRITDWWVVLVGALFALLVLVWTRASRPRLGAQD